MTTIVEREVRAEFGREFVGQVFRPEQTLRWSLNVWEYRNPEEIALYDAYRRFYIWLALDKGVSQAGVVPNIPAVQSALGAVGTDWETISQIGPRSPPRERSSFSQALGSITSGFFDIFDVITPILLSFAVGQLLGAATNAVVPADAPKVLQVLVTDITGAAVTETTGVNVAHDTSEGVSNIWSSVIEGISTVGAQAVATFGGDTPQAALASGTTATPGAFANFIKSPVGIIAGIGAVVGAIFLLRKV